MHPQLLPSRVGERVPRCLGCGFGFLVSVCDRQHFDRVEVLSWTTRDFYLNFFGSKLLASENNLECELKGWLRVSDKIRTET